MKKFLATILAICTVLSCFILPTFATGEYVAEVTETNGGTLIGTYTTLAAAVKAVNENKADTSLTLKLLGNIQEESVTVSVSGSTTEQCFYVISRNNVTLDGNKKTISAKHTFESGKNKWLFGFTGTNLTVKDLTCDCNSGGILVLGNGIYKFNNVKAYASTTNQATVKIQESALTDKIDGKYSLDFYINGGHVVNSGKRPAINPNGSNWCRLTIDGGAIFETNMTTNTTNEKAWGAIDSGNKATDLILNDAHVSVPQGVQAVRVTGTSLTVNGGVYYSSNIGLYCRSSATATVNGGYFISCAKESTTIVKSKMITEDSSTATVKGATFINVNGNTSITPYADKTFGVDKILTVGDTLAMKNGAAIRLKDNEHGIRFVSDISRSHVTASSSVSYGTIVVPTTLLEGKQFTHEGLEGVIFADIVAKDGKNMNKNGSMTVAAAILAKTSTDGELTEKEYKTALSARSYIKITVGEAVFYIYSDYSEINNSRSMYAVAEAADADTSVEWTDEQKAIINKYLGK